MTAPGEIKFTTRNNVALKILGSKSAEEYKHLALYQLLTGHLRHGLIMVKARVGPQRLLWQGRVCFNATHNSRKWRAFPEKLRKFAL